MYVRSFFTFVLIALIITPCFMPVAAQDFYSYRDSNGTRVFTNIPPSSVEESEVRIVSSKIIKQNVPVAPMIVNSPGAFDTIIRKYASSYSLDPLLIHSIIETESNFNSKAVSIKGARGLMQLMPATAERLGVEDSFDPEQNIRAGVQYFRSLMDMFNNNIDLSLAAYNAGENLVRRLGRIPSYPETINYVKSVKRRYGERLEYSQDRGNINVSQTFRYTDSAGILHLTNIPPSH